MPHNWLTRAAANFFSMAPGPHPRRELTLMPRLGFAWPRLGMAAGAHAAGAKQRPDLIRPEASSDYQRHGLGVNILSMAAGPHPRRELTPMPRLGFAWPRFGMAAGALSLAAGPHPRRELTLMPRLGFTWPRLGMAAGAREPLALGFQFRMTVIGKAASSLSVFIRNR